MFKRIILEDWHNTVPMLGFFFFFGLFLYLSCRAFLMSRNKSSEIANLPLEEEEDPAAAGRELEESTRHE